MTETISIDSGIRVESVPAWRTVFMVAGFSLLTALGAQARFPLPFTPVPLTLQTLAVMLAGYCLAPRAAFVSQALYAVSLKRNQTIYPQHLAKKNIILIRKLYRAIISFVF